MGDLVASWVYHVPGASRLESVPVVVDGVMYVSQPNEVYALDGRSGRLIWQLPTPAGASERTEPRRRRFGNKVYVGTPDAHLVALDARTGNLVWKTKLAEAKTVTGARWRRLPSRARSSWALRRAITA